MNAVQAKRAIASARNPTKRWLASPIYQDFLADPSSWHKIDFVRVRDRKAPGGWRYYAHLLVHHSGYQAPASLARRAQIPTDRRAGVDANVSNLALASFPHAHPEQLVVEQVNCTQEPQRGGLLA